MVCILGIPTQLLGPGRRLIGLVAACSAAACASGAGDAGPVGGAEGVGLEGSTSIETDGTYSMGTLLELSVVTSRPESGRAAIAEGFAVAAELEGLLSRYDPESDVSRLGAGAGQHAVPVDPRTVEVLERAVRYAALTEGCFDVTVGPLVELWIEASRVDRMPSAEAIAGARGRVGASEIEIDARRGRARLPRAGMSVDLGGVAKGYALDQMIPRLHAHDIESALLSFGRSSVWALGRPPDGDGWRLLLEGPDGLYRGVVTLRDQAFSVSSTFGKTSRIAGQSVGHVLDPRSGMPLTHSLQAAVVTDDAALAEALSTALVILGREEGVRLVEALEGVEAFLLEESGQHSQTTGWAAATRFEDLAGLVPDDAD